MAEQLTITEALAEIKTLGKRVAKKRETMQPYLARVEAMKDPLANEADGSVGFIQRELQSIADMEERQVELRRLIAQANASTELSVNGSTRTIADWLTWRREIAPGKRQHLATLRNHVEHLRNEAARKGVQLVAGAAAVVQGADVKPQDIIVNISETELVGEMDKLEEAMGTLDGLLSLKNATTTI